MFDLAFREIKAFLLYPAEKDLFFPHSLLVRLSSSLCHLSHFTSIPQSCSTHSSSFAHHVSSVLLVLVPVSIVCAFLFSVLELPQPAFWPAFIICISASLLKAIFLVFHLPFFVFACGSSLPEQTDRVVELNTLPDSLILYLTEIFCGLESMAPWAWLWGAWCAAYW